MECVGSSPTVSVGTIPESKGLRPFSWPLIYKGATTRGVSGSGFLIREIGRAVMQRVANS